MSRIEKTFAALNRPALITFIMAGDPDSRGSLAVMKALPEAGADIIELGMPFTDPMADGPTIQLAGNRALAAGQTMKKTLHIVKHFREENDKTPVVLMGYFNPVLQYGIESFMNDASAAGVDGLIIVDLPPEEADETIAAAKSKNIDIIRLLTPTTDEARLPKVLQGSSGFLYYVSITGVTGAASADLSKITPHIAQIRKHTKLPIAIGFGIRTPQDAAQMGAIADGVVVGSSIVQIIAEQPQTAREAVAEKVRALSAALADTKVKRSA
jgi:tryptophan synthase alpha chain